MKNYLKIFAQLRISDKSGRGVPKIIENYSKDAFEFRENSIVVTITFNTNRKVGNMVGDKIAASQKNGLNNTRKIILSEMRHNPNITKKELAFLIGISETAIDNNIKYLKLNGILKGLVLIRVVGEKY